MKRCPSCDHFNPIDAVTCERCGERLPSDDEPAALSAGSAGDPFENQVLETARDRGKIAAIKLYRENRGVGLKEAKEAVEALMAEHGVAAGASGGGCGTTVLALLLMGVAAARLLLT